MQAFRRVIAAAILCLGAASVLQGCKTLREIAALRSVEFALDRAADGEPAGVEIERLRSYQDLRAAEAARVAAIEYPEPITIVSRDLGRTGAGATQQVEARAHSTSNSRTRSSGLGCSTVPPFVTCYAASGTRIIDASDT